MLSLCYDLCVWKLSGFHDSVSVKNRPWLRADKRFVNLKFEIEYELNFKSQFYKS